MVSERIRNLRKRVEQRKEAASERRQKASELRKRAGADARRVGRAVFGRTAPVEEEARETKRELRMLAKEVGEPVANIARSAASGAERVRSAAGQLDGNLDEVQTIEGDVLETARAGRQPQRVSGRRVAELRESGLQKGVQAAETAFENRIKRRVKNQRLEQLKEAESDRMGLAGRDFDVDLEVVDDVERRDGGGMGDLGFDVTFDAGPGVGLLGERDPDDLEVIGERKEGF